MDKNQGPIEMSDDKLQFLLSVKTQVHRDAKAEKAFCRNQMKTKGFAHDCKTVRNTSTKIFQAKCPSLR